MYLNTSLLATSLLLTTTALAQSASVQWDNFGHIRVYSQDEKGRTLEARFDGGWSGPYDVGAIAKVGSAMTAVACDAGRVSFALSPWFLLTDTLGTVGGGGGGRFAATDSTPPQASEASTP
ncbi:uncharacterized protein AB675_4038 [Cyphellophora attinorum]|uniref:Uncharacterized protein n=1 Tax=Cyphellophora attinorum TaxID=1664694 RepID=A0A0N0NJZ9_9EURO|nr:uncharacterized protein AB675_4038 [Phialophora attinorum]KPI37571.1 hypothetical protein AB675_4038 [Phialophora attinorum]